MNALFSKESLNLMESFEKVNQRFNNS